jgi:predicted nucleic acid-binding protein
MLAVSDNSPIRYLCVLDCIHVLPVLFGHILIPYAVLRELQHPKTPTIVRTWLADSPAWLEVRAIVGRPDVALSTLESGEQEAIVLAQELRADILLVDDGKARDLAIQRGLRVMGTVGVLEQAAARGLVDLP